MGGAQVQSLTPTPRKHFGPLKGGGGGWGGWDHTNRYLVSGLSFEGGIFNEQRTTFVPICPRGGKDRCGHKIRSGCTNPAFLGGQGKCREETEHFEYKHME